MCLPDVRPYEPLNMTSEKWKAIDPELVRFEDLTFSQKSVFLDALLDVDAPPMSGDEMLHVVEYDNKLWLVDGHTRVARRILQGQSFGYGRVLRNIAPSSSR